VRRPRLTFQHDVSESIGRVFGPDGTGKEFVAMDEVVENTDGTFTAFYRFATSEDMANEQRIRRDEASGTRDKT
jgi:hypothetical protein